MNPNIERTECQKLLIESTVKIYNHKGKFIGTGFFVLPNILVSCHHVFENIQHFTINKFKQIFSTQNAIIKKEADLICIDLEDNISDYCIPLTIKTSKSGDDIWGFSHNSDYETVAISSKLIETATREVGEIFRIDDDAIAQGSSGTPLWNMRTNALLGMVYWWKERKQNAFVIPVNNFQKHFAEIFQKNIEYHQKNPYWKAAIEQDKQPKGGTGKIPKHLGTIPTFPELFIGRENEVEAVHERLKDNQNILLLVNGKGGIGKTTLASKYYYQYENYYQHLVWVFSGTSIVDALLTLAMPLGVEFPPKMPNEERFTVLLQAMAELNEPCLLIMDNANEITDIEKYHGALLKCTNFHILLTTRVNSKIHNSEIYQVQPLEPEAALHLFTKHYDTHNTNENDLFFAIYEAVDRNTLVVELLAKNLANFNNGLEQEYSLSRLLENINDSLLQLDKSEKVSTFYHAQNGIQRKETPENIIAAMYDLSGLNEIEKRLLSIFSVLPAESIPYATLKDLVTQDRLDKYLLGLFEKGWLDYDEKGKSFRISPVVQEVVRLKSDDLYGDCEEMMKTIIEKLKYEPGIGHLKNITYEMGTILVRYTSSIISNIDELQYHIPVLCERIGNYFRITGNLDKSLFYFKRCLYSQKELYESNPNNFTYKNGLIISYSKLGEIYYDYGKLNETLYYFKKDLELQKELSEEYPNSIELKHGLAISYEKLGDTHYALGRLNKSLEFYKKRLELGTELYKNNPDNINFKNGLSISYSKLGKNYSALGDLNKALNFYQKDIDIQKSLHKRYPNNVNLKNNLAIAFQFSGMTYFSLGNLDKALELFKEYNILEKELHKAYPKNTQFKNLMGISYLKLGEAHLSIGNLTEALSSFKSFMLIFEELNKNYKDNIRFKQGFAISYSKLGEYYEKTNNYENAKEYYIQAKLLLEELVLISPLFVELKEDLDHVEEALERVKVIIKNN